MVVKYNINDIIIIGESMNNGVDDELLMLRDIEVKEAHFNFWTLVFPLIFAIPFSCIGFGIPILNITGTYQFYESFNMDFTLFCIPFALIGFVTLLIPLIVLYRRIVLNLKGEYTYGVVEGYVDDTFVLNGRPGQVARIRVETDTGPRIIRYQLGTINRPYEIGSEVRLKRYRNYYLILNN
jgi:hypothetical protein